jgi:hypothetical protein
VPLSVMVDEARATALLVVAPDLAHAATAVARFPRLKDVELDLDDYTGVAEATSREGPLEGRTIRRVTARSSAQAATLLAPELTFEVVVELTRETSAWLLDLRAISPRLVLHQPSYERLTEADERDVDLREFFGKFTHPVPVEEVPPCVSGRAPRPRRRVLDTAMMTPDGKLEVFRYTRRYILEGYRAKSLRCRDCCENTRCDGMHINHVRAHGFQVMVPIQTAAAE